MSNRYKCANETNAPKATPNAASHSDAVRCVGLEKPHGKRLRQLGGPTPTSLKLYIIWNGGRSIFHFNKMVFGASP